MTHSSKGGPSRVALLCRTTDLQSESRRRLAASELATSARAWRLWSVCMDFTADMGLAENRVYVTHLAREAGVDRSDAGKLLRRFAELGIVGWDPAPQGSRTRVISRV